MYEPQHKRMLEKLCEELDQDLIATVTAAEIRNMFDTNVTPEAIDSALDYAQGSVFSGTQNEAYIVIKITR
jgi:hypothetical protein